MTKSVYVLLGFKHFQTIFVYNKLNALKSSCKTKKINYYCEK